MTVFQKRCGDTHRNRSTLQIFEVTPDSTKRDRGISVVSIWKGRLMTQKIRGEPVSKCVTVRIVEVRGESGVGNM